MSDWQSSLIEVIGWTSTAAFLISIVHPNRNRLHRFGLFTAVTTTIYAYSHGATAIWVKWVIAFFFHGYMLWKLRKSPLKTAPHGAVIEPTLS